MAGITIPRDVTPDAQRAFQQADQQLKKMDIPLLQDMASVRGIQERTSAYFKREDGILCRYTKIDDELYCEEIPRVAP